MVKYSLKLHNKIDLIKILLGFLEFKLFSVSQKKEDLIVINYHGVQKKFISSFSKQIDFLEKFFTIIYPLDLEKHFGEKRNYQGPPLLLITFDDGTKNVINAIRVLEKRNLKSMIFVVPEFIDSIDQKDFFRKQIRPNINANIDSKDEDFTALNWEELKILIKNKHCVGSHTYSHGMSYSDTNRKLIKEIVLSKKRIEYKLNNKINSFCSINNSLESLNKEASKLIKKNYRFHFTTVAGKNNRRLRYSIKRINVEAHWSKYQFIFALSRIGKLKWKLKSKKIDELMMY